jgi:phospholipid N-methyltransferase
MYFLYFFAHMKTTKRDTSKEVAEIIYNQIDEYSDNLKILEPSAGEGNLIDFISQKLNRKSNIDVIELNGDKVKILKDKGYNVIGRDYMNTIITTPYDLILACPPFKDNVNLDHIRKMYDDIKVGGVIITLCNTQWINDNNEKSIMFREFLSKIKYSMTMLPDNSFIEKDKTVPTLLIKIKKHV